MMGVWGYSRMCDGYMMVCIWIYDGYVEVYIFMYDYNMWRYDGYMGEYLDVC